jgi:hypothetical protein
MDVQRRTIHGESPAARVGAVIEEYAAYQQRDQRRLDDKRVRNYIASRLSAAMRELLTFRVENVERMNGAGEDFDVSLRRLRNAIDAVTDIPVGYSTFFDAQYVRTAETTRLVMADLELIERAQSVVQHIGALTQLPADQRQFRAGCGDLVQQVTDLARCLEQRTRLFAV